QCRRDMNRGGEPLADALWKARPHLSGNAVRKLFWDAYVEAGLEAFVRSFGRALVQVLKNKPQLRDRDLSADPFLRMRQEIEWQHARHAALVRRFCGRIGTAAPASCGGIGRALGEMDDVALARMTRNAPSRVGVMGRNVTFDGQPYRASFTPRRDPVYLHL